MRILYFYQYFTTPRGAWSTRVYEFAQRCIAKGDHVTVVTSVYDKSDVRSDKLVSQQNIDGIDVRIINLRLSNAHGFLRRVLSFAAYAVIASWYALTVKADVVVSSSGPITVALPGLLAHFLRRRRFVFEVRDLWPQGAIELGVLRNPLAISLARAVERLCYRRASKVVALSQGAAEWIRATYGATHVEVVPNASDNRLLETVAETPLPEWARGKDLIVYAGTIGLMNDCAQMVRMCSYLQRWGVTGSLMVVIGEGKELPEVQALARELALTNIRFLGQIPKPEVFQWLKRASCTLMLMRNVGVLGTVSPNKMFDSFAAGVPVVQNSSGWIKELLAREGCGLTVPPDDPEALARAVLSLISNPTYRLQMAANAQRVGREQFDRDLLAGRMRETLAAVAAR